MAETTETAGTGAADGAGASRPDAVPLFGTRYMPAVEAMEEDDIDGLIDRLREEVDRLTRMRDAGVRCGRAGGIFMMTTDDADVARMFNIGPAGGNADFASPCRPGPMTERP